jgi:serine/threonine protein kinase
LSQLKICPVCNTEYPANERFCPRDGTALRAQGEASKDLVGTIIAERYHIIKKLGEGGMGQVYLAEHVKMGRKSAVKVMNPGMVQNVDAISRFNREAQNASRINHPNVAGIYDFGETAEGLVYLAMEFIEGEPLTEIIKQHGALPPMRASEITRQAAEGLSVAHEMGIVHRDLKPDNIMIAKGRSGADLVKVVDFGIAKAAANEAQKVTKTGMVVGTPEYMSPEQLSGDPLDARSDIYALALVAFNMFTGKLPFPGETMQESMIMRLTDEPRQLAQMKPDVAWPADLQTVMDKALARKTEERYATASAFAHDLVQAIDRMPVTSITAMGTEMIRRMSAGSIEKAQTAATVQVSVPKTRIGTKEEAAAPAARASANRPPASPAVTPTKSKTGMYAGIGGGVLVLAIAGVFAAKSFGGGGKPEPNNANSPSTQTAPQGSADTTKIVNPPATSPPATQTKQADPVVTPPQNSSGASNEFINAELDRLNKRAEDTSTVANSILLDQLEVLKPKLKTNEQRVFAAVIEALAQGVVDPSGAKACDALRKVAAKAPSTSHAAEFATAYSACK